MQKNITIKKIYTSFILTISITIGLTVLNQNTIYAMNTGTITANTNNIRSSNELYAYAHNSQLASAARAKASHMCTHDYWAHTAPDGTTGWDFIRQSGYSHAVAGENLARGFNTEAEVLNGLMNSAGHRANVLSTNFKDIGIGAVACSGKNIVVALYATHKHTTQATPEEVKKPAQPRPAEVKKPAEVPKSETVSQKPQSKTNTTVLQPITNVESDKSIRNNQQEKEVQVAEKKRHPLLQKILNMILMQHINAPGNNTQTISDIFNPPDISYYTVTY